MSDLTGSTPAVTYKSLLKISNTANQVLDGTLRTIEDGLGTDSKLQLSTTAVNIVGAGTLEYAGTAITSTAAELNIMDGGTAASAITLADADRVVVNDGGTMKQVALTSFETYFETALDTLANVTTVGALGAGTIGSGFGSINNGSSTITTTGLISGGSLDIDDVVINGTTIGHTSDIDLMTLTSGQLAIAGNVNITGNITMGDDTSIGISDSDERIEFDGAGDISLLGCDVGIGTTTPDYQVEIEKVDASAVLAITCIDDTEATPPALVLRKADNNGAGAPAVGDSTACLGEIDFQGYDGAAWRNGARIRASIYGSPSSSVMPANLEFWTNDGATTATRRMTIMESGLIGVGDHIPTAKLHIDQSSASGAVPVLKLDQADVDDSFVDFIGTSAADGSRSISADTTTDSAKFGAIRIEINGVTKWIRVYDDHS